MELVPVGWSRSLSSGVIPVGWSRSLSSGVGPCRVESVPVGWSRSLSSGVGPCRVESSLSGGVGPCWVKSIPVGWSRSLSSGVGPCRVDSDSVLLKTSTVCLFQSKVDYIAGHATFTTDRCVKVGGATYSADHYLIATGGRPVIPNIPGEPGSAQERDGAKIVGPQRPSNAQRNVAGFGLTIFTKSRRTWGAHTTRVNVTLASPSLWRVAPLQTDLPR